MFNTVVGISVDHHVQSSCSKRSDRDSFDLASGEQEVERIVCFLNGNDMMLDHQRFYQRGKKEVRDYPTRPCCRTSKVVHHLVKRYRSPSSCSPQTTNPQTQDRQHLQGRHSSDSKHCCSTDDHRVWIHTSAVVCAGHVVSIGILR